jgi:CHASE3 domain sensor protein
MKASSKSLAFFGVLFTVVLVYVGYSYYVTEKEVSRKWSQKGLCQ